MKRLLGLALLLPLLLGGCIIWDPHNGADEFDFNGIWSLALTGCQAQTANAEIWQDGTAFTMYSGPYQFFGNCDPFAATFAARAEGPWGYWDFAGGASDSNTLSGTYLYADFRGECTGTFTANRIAFRGADLPAGPALERKQP